MQQVSEDSTARESISSFLLSASREQLHAAFSEPWLNALVPGINKLVGCDQGIMAHLEGDAAVHTSYVFENMKLTAPKRLGREADMIELLSAVLHDLKKPQTRQPQLDGGVAFPGHEALAAQEIPSIAKSIELDQQEAQRLQFLVAHHGDAANWNGLEQQLRSKIKSSPWLKSLALLQESDALSCIMPDGKCLPILWNEITQ